MNKKEIIKILNDDISILQNYLLTQKKCENHFWYKLLEDIQIAIGILERQK